MSKRKSKLNLSRKKTKHFNPGQVRKPITRGKVYVNDSGRSPSLKTPHSTQKRCSVPVFSPKRSPIPKKPRLFSPKVVKGSRYLISSKSSSKTLFHETIPEGEYARITEEEENGIKPLSDTSIEDSSCLKEKDLASEITDLLPTVLSEIEKSGLDASFLKDFCTAVANGKFPLNNVSFLLWVEVIKWYQQDTTTTMRYMDDTKKFWKLGWRHFGGRFIRFMSGFKNTSQLSNGETERGLYHPEQSDINFAIPSLDVLRKYTPYGEDRMQRNPGTCLDAITRVSNAIDGTSACISFDGKKLKQGLTETSGDVNLLGFGKGESLADRQTENNKRLQCLLSIQRELDTHALSTDLQCIPDYLKSDLKCCFLTYLRLLSLDAQIIRSIQSKKEYALEKFIERGGDNWRQGKFAFVVSAIKAFLYDIGEFLRKFRLIIEALCEMIAYLNNLAQTFRPTTNVDLLNQENYNEIERNQSEEVSRKVKQRSSEWFDVRKGAIVTGSTLYQAVGLDTLKRQREYFDSVVCKEKVREKPSNVQEAMQYGTENEINATATFTGKVLPVVAPMMNFQEEGYIKKTLTEDGHYMVISPDGSLFENDKITVSAVEFKCPVKQLHTELPHRFYLQCQATMRALDVKNMYYLCWRPDTSTVFEICRDDSTFDKSMDMITSLYASENPKRPSKLPADIKSLKEDIEIGRKRSVFVGEFPSAYASSPSEPKLGTKSLKVQDAHDMCERLLEATKESYHLRREKATEAVVFLCSDLDRSYNKNPLRWAPLNWFPKGYSLSTEVMRDIMENVLNECHKEGLHVPAISFDGQWHNIATRALDDRPLTLLQLMKDTWKYVEKKQKSEIVKEFVCLNKESTLIIDGMKHICTNGGQSLPHTPSGGWFKPGRPLSTTSSTPAFDQANINELVPESVVQSVLLNASGVDMDTLAQLPVDEREAAEISSCNVDDEIWSSFLEDNIEPIQDENTDSNLDQFINNGTPPLPTDANDASSDAVCSHLTLLSKEADVLLAFLRSDPTANKKGIWNNKTTDDIYEALSTFSSLKKLLNSDLKVVVRFIKGRILETNLKESDTKAKKLGKLCTLLGFEETANKGVPRKTSKKSPKQLSELSKGVLMSQKTPKSVLNVAYASYIWPQKLNNWKSTSPISDDAHVNCANDPDYWFSVPEYNELRQQLEVKSVDATHLFTRLRRHSCKGRIDGVSNEAWMQVAQQGNTYLSQVMVDDVVDPMSVSMARTHFSESVENEMRKNGNAVSANLCQDIRKWWVSNDDPGISALERTLLRTSLRKRLLRGIDFANPTFPPPTMYINGFPIQLWEALLVDIDAKAQLYAICQHGTYNVRAFSSMMGESFFAELTLQDNRGHGAVTCDDFSRYIGKVIEQMQARLDQTRCFTYRTSRKAVYTALEKEDVCEASACDDTDEPPDCTKEDIRFAKYISAIVPKNHDFDMSDRRRIKGKPKEGTISRSRTSIQKGTLGVRWEKARVNQSKLLPTKRMGLSD